MTQKQDNKNEIRKQQYFTRLAIIEQCQNGMSGQRIAKMLGISEGYVSRIKNDFEQNGYAALEQYKRGTPWGNETREMWEKERIRKNDIE